MFISGNSASFPEFLAVPPALLAVNLIGPDLYMPCQLPFRKILPSVLSSLIAPSNSDLSHTIKTY